MHEIERQFLVRSIEPEALDAADRRSRIRQGYLTATGPAIRVREYDGRPVMTVKEGVGLVRREVEWEIPPEVADQLFELAGHRILEKTRHHLGPWEVDVFDGKLAGLVIAEVELNRADAPTPAFPAGLVLGTEVTEDITFTNQYLSGLSPSEARELIRTLVPGSPDPAGSD